MTRLTWGEPGTRRFESGLDHGVLYPLGGAGVAWNGLRAVNNRPSGGEPRAYYIDGMKYINAPSTMEFDGTIEAFTYPDEFAECDGTKFLLPGFAMGQQRSKPFGLSYRTKVGTDTGGQDYGYKIHLIYNALAAPSQKGYTSLSSSPEALAFTWDFSTTPTRVAPGFKPAAHVTIDTTKVLRSIVEGVEEYLYGSETLLPGLPTPAQMLDLFATNGPLEVIPLTGGGYRVQGSTVEDFGFGIFEIDDSAVVDNGDGSFTII